MENCPHCDSNDIVTDYSAGDLVCRGCGVVLSERIVNEILDCAHGSGGDSVYPLLSSVLATSIETTPGACLNGRGASSYHNIAGSDRNERDLLRVLGRQTSLCERLKLSNAVVTRSHNLMGRVITKIQGSRWRSSTSISAACVYVACRLEGVPRTIREVASAAGVAYKQLGRSYISINQGLKLELEVVDSRDYTARVCSQLRLTPRVGNLANRIITELRKLKLQGSHTPMVLAAACISVAAQLLQQPRATEQVAEAVNQSERTVTITLKEIIPKLGQALPTELQLTAGMIERLTYSKPALRGRIGYYCLQILNHEAELAGTREGSLSV